MGLEVTGISVRFGGHVALDDVALHAESGQITGLIGPNGAGKTTLFNVITGVQQPDRGHVVLDGRRLEHVPAHRRARLGLGRTFQRLELFGSLTVRDNLLVAASALPRSRHRAVTDGLLERLGLTGVADVRADAVSTGTGRLVELARCLATGPRVLLLDEPASGQDDHETARFAEIIGELAGEGMAVVLVEHDMDLVMLVCHQVHVLDFGHLLASGPPAFIRADPAVRAAYLGEEASDDHPHL
jgi:branched-chain amino acid transport system ATP-binding protein